MSNPAELKAIRLPCVKARTGLGRSQIYKLESEGNFPKRIKLGKRASAWFSHEIDAWLLERAALGSGALTAPKRMEKIAP